MSLGHVGVLRLVHHVELESPALYRSTYTESVM